MKNGNVIEVKNVSKSFPDFESMEGAGGLFASLRRKKSIKHALDKVDFSVKGGDFVAVLGQNGAGKSTLLKILTGILYPDSGNASVLGLNPYKNRARLAMRIGAVFGAKDQLWWDLPAIDTFIYMKRLYKIPDAQFNRLLKHFVSALNLEDVYKRQVRTMSLGQRMKCNFVAAMLHLPELVILDEPTIGMDVQSKFALFKLLINLRKEYGMTFLLATNLMDEVEIMAQKVILLDYGRVMFNGDKSEMVKMIGSSKQVELHLKPGFKIDAKRYGSVLESRGNMVRFEIDREKIKSKALVSLLTSDKVSDYNVSEPDLNEVLGRFYAAKKERRRQMFEE